MREENIFMPMNLEALVLDDLVGGGSSMRRWAFSYQKMDMLKTPEPDAFSNNKQIKERGVWLRWTLPGELRTQTDQGVFPLIPNRWLIVRVAQETGEMTARVLESDCPMSSCMSKMDYGKIMPYTTQFLIGEEVRAAFRRSGDPYRRGAYAMPASAKGCYFVNLGIPFPLESWQERERGCLFVTACAPGNPNFTGYVQHNSNMLSFFDNLENSSAATFHYSVIGWFSQPEEHKIYCSGQVFSVPWNLAGFPIIQGKDRYHDQLDSIVQEGSLQVAVGQTSNEAFSVYLQSKLNHEHENIGLLLASLQEEGQFWGEEGNLASRLKDTLHQDMFQEKYGGNRESAEFDEEVRILHSLQEELLDSWWKREFLERNPDFKTGKSASDLHKEFRMDIKESLLARTVSQFERVKDMFGEVRLREKADKDGDGRSHKLLGRFWRKENPYLLISGLEGAGDLSLEDTVTRKEQELLKGDIPLLPGVLNLPGEVRLLLGEALAILHRVYLKGETCQGVLPDYPIEPWRQPWKPAFMEWRVNFEELPVDGRNREAYYFDGYEYQLELDKSPDPSRQRGYGGISGLDIHKKKLFADKIRKCGENLEGSEKDKLLELAQVVEGWKLLGQELVNLQDSMAQRDYRSFRRPYGEDLPGIPYSLDQLLGFWDEDSEFYDRVCGRMESIPLTNANVIPPYRYLSSGKMHLDDLIFYDPFGRVLNMVCSGEGQGLYQCKNYPLLVPQSMRAGKESQDNGFLIKPGLLQFCRLNMHYLSEGGEDILGFVILNRLNHSLSLYAPTGEALGELILTAREQGGRRASFCPFGEREENQPEQIEKRWKSLGKFIGVQKDKNEWEFTALLDVIDKAFWTMDAAGANSDERVALMAGRPLVLVQVEAFLELCGLPKRDVSWKGGGEVDWDEVSFPLCLGNLSVAEDGVVGYFPDDKFQLFYSLSAPEKCVETICSRKTGKDGVYLQTGCGSRKAVSPYLLYDPLLAIHAYTGILPVKTLQLEKEMVLDRLKKLEISFRIGPLPVRLHTDPSDGAEEYVEMTKPALPGGTFLWTERTETEQAVSLYTIRPVCGPGEGTPQMREGKLLWRHDEKRTENDIAGERMR